MAFREGDGRCDVEVIGHGLQQYHAGFCCQRCGRTFEPLRPILFSFNHPLGACPDCKGFGNVLRYDPALVIPDHSKSLVQGAIEPWSKPGTDWWQKQMLLAMKRKGVDITRPFKLLDEDVKTLLWKGDKTFDGIDDFFSIWRANVTNFMCAFCSAATGRPSIAPAVTGAGSSLLPGSSKSAGSTSMTSPQ